MCHGHGFRIAVDPFNALTGMASVRLVERMRTLWQSNSTSKSAIITWSLVSSLQPTLDESVIFIDIESSTTRAELQCDFNFCFAVLVRVVYLSL